jgi:hypothetical protein
MALLATVSTSSTRVNLICSPLLLVSQVSVSPINAGQKGLHSWLSMDDNATISFDSCSQTIRQNSLFVLSRGCWVTMNSRRSKKPVEWKRKLFGRRAGWIEKLLLAIAAISELSEEAVDWPHIEWRSASLEKEAADATGLKRCYHSRRGQDH